MANEFARNIQDASLNPVALALPGAASTTVTGTVATLETRPGTSTKSNVAAAAADTLLLASNANRRGSTIFNDSSAILYISLGTVAASTSSYTLQCAGLGFYEVPFSYTGEIRGIWASATGNARVCEIT